MSWGIPQLRPLSFGKHGGTPDPQVNWPFGRYISVFFWYISLTNTHLAWAALLLYKKHLELPPTASFDAAIGSALCPSPGGRPPYLGDGLLCVPATEAMAGGCYFVKIGENVGFSWNF